MKKILAGLLLAGAAVAYAQDIPIFHRMRFIRVDAPALTVINSVTILDGGNMSISGSPCVTGNCVFTLGAPSGGGTATAPTGTGLFGATAGVMDAAAITMGNGMTLSAGALSRDPLTGDVTTTGNAATIGNNAVVTAHLLNANVTYAKIQNVAASSLMGNATGSPAAPAGIALNSTLEFASGALGRAATTGDVVCPSASNACTIQAGAVVATTDITGVLPLANGGTGASTAADDALLVGSGTGWVAQSIPSCSAAGEALKYNNTTNTLSCNSALVSLQASTPGTAQVGNINVDTTIIGNDVYAASARILGWVTKSKMISATDGVITVSNAATTDFTKVNFGGNSSSFPSLGVDVANMQVSVVDASAGLRTSTFRVGGGFKLVPTNKTSSFTADMFGTVYTADATSGAIVVTLPAATGTGYVLYLTKTDASANAVTPTRAGSDTINGATTYTLASQYDWVTLQDCASAKWCIFSRGPNVSLQATYPGTAQTGNVSITGTVGASVAFNSLSVTAPVSTPAAGINTGTVTVAGKPLPSWTDLVGQTFSYQDALWRSTWGTFGMAGATTVYNTGVAITVLDSATASTNPPSSTSRYTQNFKATYTAATGANHGAGVSDNINNPMFWRGNAAGLGGFFFYCRFGIDTWTTGNRLFVGMSTDTIEYYTGDPSAATADHIGICIDAGDSVFKLCTRDNTTNTKTTITGIPAPASTGANFFDLYLYAKPNDSVIYYRVDDLVAGTTLVDTSISTTIPRNTAFIGPVVVEGTGANVGAAAAKMSIAKVWVSALMP